jgi:hypothetical protein
VVLGSAGRALGVAPALAVLAGSLILAGGGAR